MLKEAVVLPAPLQPLIMYSFFSSMLKGRELSSYSKYRVAAISDNGTKNKEQRLFSAN